MLLTRYTTII